MMAFGSRFTVPVVLLAAVALAAVPVAIALDEFVFTGDEEVVYVEGVVTEYICCEEYLGEEPCDCACEDCEDREGAFLLLTDEGEEILVKFGPWWYWDTQILTVRDVVTQETIDMGHTVNVTGVMTDVDGVLVLEAWTILNEHTGDEITIKVEGRTPWAGGPEELGVEPWPPSCEDDG